MLMTNNPDMDEKLVYTVIKEAGNKGIWIRDIGIKTNVKSAVLNKTLKNLEVKFFPYIKSEFLLI